MNDRRLKATASRWTPTGPESSERAPTLSSRQTELVGLGAYFTSLREYRLVFPGTLGITMGASPSWLRLSSRHTRDGESRERLREAFNTPLYPMILIANEVMQEGLDLHKHGRRIVHHDLVWNPAQVEQRIGRIDPLGSLDQPPAEERR